MKKLKRIYLISLENNYVDLTSLIRTFTDVHVEPSVDLPVSDILYDLFYDSRLQHWDIRFYTLN